MKVTQQEQTPNDSKFLHWHKLVVAEAGFSMLDIYGRQVDGLEIEEIREFAESVNRRNEAGSLHPKAPISALPKRYFRNIEETDIPNYIQDFKKDLREFISANRHTIKSKQVLIDFHVSNDPVARQYIAAIEAVFDEQKDEAGIEEIVIII